MTGTRRVPRRAIACLLVVLVTLLAGCRSEEDPRSELEAAVAATAATPFTFALSARADRAALDELGGDAAEAAAFLEGAAITGGRDPDGDLQVAITLGGGAPLLEAISHGEDGLLLRTGLGELLGLEGRDPNEALAPALDELGVEDAGREALATSFAGGWVALTDVGDLGELLGSTTDTDPGTAPDGLGALLDEVTVTGARDAGEIRRLDIEVHAAAWLGPLGLGGDARGVPGTVDLRDGRILEVRLELAGGDLAPADGTDTGADGPDGTDTDTDGVVELVLHVTPVAGGEAAVEAPEPGASLTAAELLDLVERLQDAGGVPAG